MPFLKTTEFFGITLAVTAIILGVISVISLQDARVKQEIRNSEMVSNVSDVHNTTSSIDTLLKELEIEINKSTDTVATLEMITIENRKREETNAQRQQRIISRIVTDCKKFIVLEEHPLSEVRLITIGKELKNVLCDMESDDGGGWTMIQRRTGQEINFYRIFTDYENGFGYLENDFWLGLKYIYELTNKEEQFSLRVDLEDFSGATSYALYSSFSLDYANGGYVLRVDGYSGTAGDSLPNKAFSVPFSTSDRDKDGNATINCAEIHRGGWWYNDCGLSNLNGRYLAGGIENSIGMYWYSWKNSFYSLKTVVMKIRPV